MFIDEMWHRSMLTMLGVPAHEKDTTEWRKVRNQHAAEQRELMLRMKKVPPFSASLHVAALHQILRAQELKADFKPIRVIIGEPDNPLTSPTVIAAAMYFAAMFPRTMKVYLAMSRTTLERYHSEVSAKLHGDMALRTYFLGLDPELAIPPRWFVPSLFWTCVDKLGIEIIDPENLAPTDAKAIGDFLAAHLTEKDPPLEKAIKMPVWVAAACAVMKHRGISYCFAGKGVPSADVITANIRLGLQPGERLTSMALLHRRFVPEGCPHVIVLADPAVTEVPTIEERVQFARLVARTMVYERSIHNAFAHPDDAETGPLYMGISSYGTKKSGRGKKAKECAIVAELSCAAVAHLGVHCWPHPMQHDAQYNAATTKGPHEEGYGRSGGNVAFDLICGNTELKDLSLNGLMSVTSGPMLVSYRLDDTSHFRPSVIGDQSRDDGTRALVQSMVDTVLYGFICHMQGSVAAH